MEDSSNLPFEKLAEVCCIINPPDPKAAVQAAASLAETCTKEQLIGIYNYFFENTNCYELLIFLLNKIEKFKDKSSTPILIDSLLMKEKMKQRIPDSDQLTRIRTGIAKALAASKDSQAVYPLLYCLNDKDENYKIKLACADALGRIGDRYAVLPLIKIAEDDAEASVYVRESAVSALGMIGDEKAVEPLVSILETKKGFIDKFSFLKERALEALNKLKFSGSRVFNALEKSLRDESKQVRINAIEVLMNSNDSRAPELIKSMLFDNDRDVVKNAVTALYNILGAGVLEDIINDKNVPDTAKSEAVNLKEDIIENNSEDNEDE